MRRPSVSIGLSNGGLNIQGPSENGTSVLIIASPAAPAAGYGVPFIVKSKTDAKAALSQAENAPVLSAIEKGFFAEAPEGTTLVILCMAQVTTLAQMAAAATAELALNKAGGAARLVAFAKLPAVGYAPVVGEGLDSDVHACVTAAQTLAGTWLDKKKPFRYFVQGYGYTGNVADLKDYSQTTNRNGHLVLGSVGGSTLLALMLCLGRAARILPNQNIGRIRTGSLAIDPASAVTIGATAVDNMDSANLDTIWEKRYITFEKNQIASGYVFNDDNSLTAVTDDYNNLRNGRVIDNAVRVAFATYYKELKEDVEVDDGGRLAPVVEKALETEIEVAINQKMPGQLSTKNDGSADITCLVNPDPALFAAIYAANGVNAPNFNVFDGGNVYIFTSLRPKGCLKQINVFLGFTA